MLNLDLVCTIYRNPLRGKDIYNIISQSFFLFLEKLIMLK